MCERPGRSRRGVPSPRAAPATLSAGHCVPDVGGGVGARAGLAAAGQDKSHHMVPDSDSPAINNRLPFGLSRRAPPIPAQVAEKCKMLFVLILSAVCAGRRRRGLEGPGAGPGHPPKPGAWPGGPEAARTKAAPAPHSPGRAALSASRPSHTGPVLAKLNPWSQRRRHLSASPSGSRRPGAEEAPAPRAPSGCRLVPRTVASLWRAPRRGRLGRSLQPGTLKPARLPRPRSPR